MLEGSAIINLFFTVIKLFSFRKFLMQTVEAVARRRSVEKVFLKLCKIHRKTPVPEPLFLMKLQPHPQNTKALINSICQDLMYSFSIRTKKHAHLGLCLKRITGSKECLQWLNRSGHCISYDEVSKLFTFFYDTLFG